MSTDFFADLERQLVDATPRRRRRLRRARARRAATGAAALAAVVVAIVALGSTLSGGDRDVRPRPAAPGPASPTYNAGMVAVLNGTPTPGLARSVANRLQKGGILIGNVTNAPRQDATRTEVAYVPHHAQWAIRVAARLQLGDTVLRPATRAERARAGLEAWVIVIVGPDGGR
jgi:hypothetical protein